MAKRIGGGAGYAVLLLIVLIAGRLVASHEFFPAGGTSAVK